MIEVKNLTKFYGNYAAIEGVSFTVPKGRIIGFLGPNGAGKTTTMKIITSFLPPSSGEIKVCGFDTMKQDMEVKKRIGYLPEIPPLYTEMTVTSYLDFTAKIKGVKNSKKRKERLGEILKLCTIEDVKNKLISQLSKGYRQRVGLAQALIHDPEVLIFDEPTIGLDPKQILETRKLIKSLGGQRTILLSTHILPEVEQTCDRVVIINKGKIVAEDSPENLSSSLKGAKRIHLQVRGSKNEVETKLKEIQGINKITYETSQDGVNSFLIESVSKDEISEQIARTVVKNDWGLIELHPISISLEDIFLKLTTSERQAGHV